METVFDILGALENDNSRNYKEDVLLRNSGNELLKRVFVAVGDPYVNFFVNKFKMPPALGSDDDDVVLDQFLDDIYKYLATREKTGNAAKEFVIHSFRNMTPLQQKWCLRVILRNLRVGVSEATVSKVWPGVITKFSVQLAESLNAVHEEGVGLTLTDELKYPVRVEPKLDGLRCIAVKRGGVVTMFTRNGTQLETLPTIKAALEAASWDDFVLDGEAMGADWNESASVVMSHKTNKDDSGIVYNVFDAMTFDEWRDQVSESPLTERVELVSELVVAVNSTHVVAVDGETVTSESGLMAAYSRAIQKGYEGVMVKSPNAPYVFKRSKSVLKLKPVATYEGVVVGHYEGKRGSKREGLWGGFDVVMPNGVVTRVGGGFTDKLKAEIGIDPDSWIGAIVEMEGQPDPQTKDGLTEDGKVRFPVFVRRRDPSDVDPRVLEAAKEYLEKI